jgi:neutral trehalase
LILDHRIIQKWIQPFLSIFVSRVVFKFEIKKINKRDKNKLRYKMNFVGFGICQSSCIQIINFYKFNNIKIYEKNE